MDRLQHHSRLSWNIAPPPVACSKGTVVVHRSSSRMLLGQSGRSRPPESQIVCPGRREMFYKLYIIRVIHSYQGCHFMADHAALGIYWPIFCGLQKPFRDIIHFLVLVDSQYQVWAVDNFAHTHFDKMVPAALGQLSSVSINSLLNNFSLGLLCLSSKNDSWKVGLSAKAALHYRATALESLESSYIAWYTVSLIDGAAVARNIKTVAGKCFFI